MPEQKEIISLEAVDKTGPATKSANKNIGSVEKAADDASEAITGTTAAATRKAVAVTDAGLTSIKRLVEKAERDAERVTMTKVEQLQAHKARQLALVSQDDTKSSNRIAAAYDKIITQAKAAEEATRNAAAASQVSQVKATGAATAINAQAAAYDKAAVAAQRLAVAQDAGAGGMERFLRTAKSFQNITSSLGQSLTVGLTLPIGLAAKATIGVAERLDQIDKSITTILGSQALSGLVQKELRDASAAPGLTFEGAAQGFRRIVSARRDIKLATEAVKEFGNALALAGGTEEDLQGVSLALTQILSKAKVSAEEVNQLAERIPATRRMIQGAFGTSDSEAIAKRGITPDAFVRGIVEQAKLLPRAPESMTSQLKNVREDFRAAMGLIGKDVAAVLLPLLKSATAALRSFVDGFAQLPTSIRQFAVVSALLAATLGPLLVTLSGIARVASTVAQVMVVLQASHARATTAAVANTAAVTAEARAYDALAVSAGRASAVQGGGTSTALARSGIAFTGGTAELTTMVSATRTATVAVEAYSGSVAAATAAGAYFLTIPLVGYLQGVGRAFGDLMQSTHSAIVFNENLGTTFDATGKQVEKFGDRVNKISGTQEGGLVKILMAAAREARDLATALAKDLFEPQRVGMKAWADLIGPTFDSLSERYNDFVDRVSKSQFAKDWLLPLQELIDAGKRRLTVEKLGEDAMKAAQTLSAKGDREQAERAGALKKRGEEDTKRLEEDAKIAARRAELTRDLRLELTKSTTEAERAGKEISEVQRVAADRAQERVNMIEREGAAVGHLQKKLFDMATTQKILEADRKNSQARMAEATKFRDAAMEKELTGLAKIAEQRRQAVAALGTDLSSADRTKAMGVIDAGTAALTTKYMDQLLKESTDFFNQSVKIAGEGYDKLEEQRREWLEKVKASPDAVKQVTLAIAALENKLTRDLEREYAAREAARGLRGLDAQRDSYLRQLELQHAREMEIETSYGHENMNRRIQYEQDRLAVERDFAERRMQMEIEAIEKRRDLAIKEAVTDKQKDDIRRKAGEDTKDTRQQTQIDIDAKRQQTAIRLEEIIRAENQKTFDAFKRGYDDVFDALILRTKSFKDVMKSIMIATFVTPIKEATGNIFAKAMTDIFGVKRGGAARIQSKLELPNRIGDMQLQGGAIPVVIMGTSPQAASQIAAPTSTALSRLGNLGGFLGGLGTLRGTPPFVPGGTATSQTIDYGGGKISLGGVSYPGTPPIQPEGGGAGGGITGGLTGAWKGMLGDITKLGNIGQGAGGAAAKGVGGLGGGLMTLGGAGLIAAGMYKGGWSGVGMTTAGGALIGAKFGGPMGAAIGGAAGFVAGMIRKQFKGKDEQIIAKVKSMYGVTLDKKFAMDPIGAIVQSKYGGNLDVGLRSAEVRDLVNLYGRSTGQAYGIANKAFGVGLEQTGGVLSQYAARADGLNVAYSGGSLGLSGPVDKLVTSTVGDTSGMAQTINVQSLQLLVNGQSAAAALSAGVVENPAAVAQATLTANRRGINRRENVSVQQTPGLLMS
jgi:tape measure domain-containing protein